MVKRESKQMSEDAKQKQGCFYLSLGDGRISDS